ncbi:MAG: hypothetical protein HYX92_06075 [Chloroflexi bacterium]|nr:hypothetical protein [Chloroflexota bacterium]
MRGTREFLSDLLSGVGASTIIIGLLLIALLAMGIIPFQSSYGGILSLLLLPALAVMGVLMVVFGRVIDYHPSLPPVAGGSPDPKETDSTAAS